MTVADRPRAMQVAAQAKINLRLRILAREASGYHQIETLFLRLELADDVRIRLTSGERSLDVTGADPVALGPVEKNLAWRAAESYFAASETRGGFAIELTKRIPVGGGLGGGSADAGAVLRALDAMADHPLGEASLVQLASALGSDVPFLASTHAYVLAWGRGERMLALTPPTARDVRLLLPAFAVNTADAYGWLATARVSNSSPETMVVHPPQLEGWDSLARLAINDFEAVVAARHPEIDEILSEELADPSVEFARLSGSGSSIFAIGRSGAILGVARAKDDAGTRLVMTRTATRVEPPSRIE